MLSRRLLPLATAVIALALPASALAVVNGEPVAAGAYPANGFLGIDSDGNGQINSICSGTLVGSRQFLTAARCTTNTLGFPRSPGRLTVQIGGTALPDGTVVENVATNDVPDADENTSGYIRSSGANDVAMLTLTASVDTELTRVVDATETATWAPGTLGRVLGWGETENSAGAEISESLLKGDVTIRDDADCPGADFDAAIMLCAAGSDQNPCASDSGSPLLVPDGSLFALAGVFSGDACATADAPGRFARVGEGDLSEWVHDRTPEADWNFVVDQQPQATVPFEIQSVSRHPEGANYFTTFRWDLNRDGTFGDKVGKRISVTIGSPGEAVIGLEASKPGGDKATIYYAFDVLERFPSHDPPTLPTAPPFTVIPPTSNPVANAALASILNARRPKVRGGRFPIRIFFAQAAPRGTAVIEVYRGSRRIGIARTKVERGATKRVRVKLTPTGRRMLRRADSKRLKIRVRVRVGSKLLRTKRLTIRR